MRRPILVSLSLCLLAACSEGPASLVKAEMESGILQQGPIQAEVALDSGTIEQVRLSPDANASASPLTYVDANARIAIGANDTLMRSDSARPSNADVPLDDPSEGSATFVATARVNEHPDVVAPGNGDLWPSCWSDDGELYAAWGDGWGFDPERRVVDIGVARITGSPRESSLHGQNLAIGDAVGQLWVSGAYSRKPTGMACIDGALYLAVQNLAHDFDDAPVATIARSRDKGRSWEWDRTAPMFNDHQLTTIFFLDYGRDGEALSSGPYVYAYALDGNWRDSFSGRAADPTRLWLARIPRDALLDRARWEWFAMLDERGVPRWSSRTEDRAPVLVDERRVYVHPTADIGTGVSNMSVIAQGGVVYNAQLL